MYFRGGLEIIQSHIYWNIITGWQQFHGNYIFSILQGEGNRLILINVSDKIEKER